MAASGKANHAPFLSFSVRYSMPIAIVLGFVLFVSWQNHQFEHVSAAAASSSLQSSLISSTADHHQHPISTRRLLSSSSSRRTESASPLLRSRHSRHRVTKKRPNNKWSVAYPIGIPEGTTQNLPRLPVDSAATDENRKQTGKLVYGGNGDPSHLGGFTELDLAGVSPATWRGMIQEMNIHSLLDVGCGRGVSTSWFSDHGVKVLCVEGSSDAKQQSALDDPETQMVEHDYSRGPWWPQDTYDAVWSVEFLEHVGLNHQFNYISTFRKAALLFVSTSRWGGWHHVEVHEDEWWKLKYESYGFRFSEELTKEVRYWARREARIGDEVAPNGNKYNAQHLWLTMKVFVNPVVAALPQHAHLFSQHGCFSKLYEPDKQCDSLERGYYEAQKSVTPIALTEEMDQKWDARIKRNIGMEK